MTLFDLLENNSLPRYANTSLAEGIGPEIGILRTPAGEFTVGQIQSLDFPTQYCLHLLDSDNNTVDSIAELAGNEVELLTTHLEGYPLIETTQWSGWDALNSDVSHDQTYEYFDRVLSEFSGKLLLVGCGVGTYLDTLHSKFDAQGIDANARNVQVGKNNKRSIEHADLFTFQQTGYDVIIEPGVLSAGVVPAQQAQQGAQVIYDCLNPGGTYIHIPASKSLLTQSLLEDVGFEVTQMTEPTNLFTFDAPKQVYIGRK